MSETHPQNPFSRMHAGGDNVLNRIADEQARFEAATLRYTLQRLSLKHHERTLGRLWETQSGRYQLRFDAFNNHFSTFPFVLGTNKLSGVMLPSVRGEDGKTKRTPYDYVVHRDPACAEPARFKSFKSIPFYLAYQRFREEVPPAVAKARSVGLIFPRFGLRPGLVIHNDASEQFWHHGLCWVYKDPDDESRLYVQPYSVLLAAIHANGRGWRPPGE